MSPDTTERETPKVLTPPPKLITEKNESASTIIPSTSKESSTVLNSTFDIDKEKIKTEMRANDGSKNAERRKIIPEEVVDKILEKFQQLRQEAKHMALLETQHGHNSESDEQEGKNHFPLESLLKWQSCTPFFYHKVYKHLEVIMLAGY